MQPNRSILDIMMQRMRSALITEEPLPCVSSIKVLASIGISTYNRDAQDVISQKKSGNHILNPYSLFFGSLENFTCSDKEFYGEICIPKFGNKPGFISEESFGRIMSSPEKFGVKPFKKGKPILITTEPLEYKIDIQKEKELKKSSSIVAKIEEENKNLLKELPGFLDKSSNDIFDANKEEHLMPRKKDSSIYQL